MSIEVKEVFSNKDKHKFFKFFIDLYKDNSYCAPKLYEDERAEFDAKSNEALANGHCRMFLAYNGRRIVGRLAATCCKDSNSNQMRFARYDVIDDIAVTKALFGKLTQWATEVGAQEIIGPIGLSESNQEGMLIEGFDQECAYFDTYNHRYYIDHMNSLGAYKLYDRNSYKITVPDEMDPRIERLAKLLMKRYGYTIVDVANTPRRKLKQYIRNSISVAHQVDKCEDCGADLSEEQVRRRINLTIKALKPEFATIVLQKDNIVGYGIVIPAMAKALRKARGRLISAVPSFLRAMNNVEEAEMMSFGVSEQHAKQGVSTIILYNCLKGLHSNGTKYVESMTEAESDNNETHLWKNFDKKQHKKHRCWGIRVSHDQ